MTMLEASKAEKNKLYNEIRHQIAMYYSCPEFLTMNDLRLIHALVVNNFSIEDVE